MEPLLTILASVASAALAVGVSWGLLKGDIHTLKEKNAALEKAIDTKASKELVDGIIQRISELKSDLHDRLDRIEALIEKVIK